WHRRAREASQQRKLARVSHRIRKRALQQTLLSHSLAQRIAVAKMLGQQSEHLVKPLDLFVKRRERLGPVMTTDKKRACVTQHTTHVPHEFRGRSHSFPGTERSEIAGRLA